MRGLEPPRPYGPWLLRPSCMPVPAHPRDWSGYRESNSDVPLSERGGLPITPYPEIILEGPLRVELSLSGSQPLVQKPLHFGPKYCQKYFICRSRMNWIASSLRPFLRVGTLLRLVKPAGSPREPSQPALRSRSLLNSRTSGRRCASQWSISTLKSTILIRC